MSLALLAALALASSSKYDVFLGMPEKTAQEVRGMVQTMKTVQGADWTPRVEATTSVSRDTLVMWSWPLKGNHGIGLQLYAPNGQFKTRLEDSNIPAALAAVCGNRYVVGGGNTLRVWDARQNYRLIVRKTFPSLSQFARLSCTRNILTAEEGTSYEVGPWRTVLRLKIPSLLPAPGPIASSPQYDLQLGLSALEWQAILANTLGKVSVGYAVTQKLSTASGDTLVRWSSTPGLDPKGPNGLGVQVYGPDGIFRQWLPDAARIDRAFVLCGPYLVGGDNTLRVWDAGQNYTVVSRRTVPDLSPFARLKCGHGTVTVENMALLNSSKVAQVFRFNLPALTPMR